MVHNEKYSTEQVLKVEYKGHPRGKFGDYLNGLSFVI